MQTPKLINAIILQQINTYSHAHTKQKMYYIFLFHIKRNTDNIKVECRKFQYCHYYIG